MPPALPRRPLRRLLQQLLFAGVGVVAAPGVAAAESEADDDDAVVEDVIDAAIDLFAGDEPDPITGGQALAIVLKELPPLEATWTAATAALSDRPLVRCAIGEALAWPFPLGGDDVVIDHLSRDPLAPVRFASVRAATARRAGVGDDALARLSHDPDPEVAEAAIRALHGR